MDKKVREILQQFQCDYNRMLEESFAQTLSENDQVRLFFINENQAFTDGKNIVVDPAYDELFIDQEALKDTANVLGYPVKIFLDEWNALRIITRAQTIHESLHIIYTDLPAKIVLEPRFNTKAKLQAIHSIHNIIEDAYIEAVGCSIYDNMEFYLRFFRISHLFLRHQSTGTIKRNFEEIASQAQDENQHKVAMLTNYLDYMAGFLLYPMLELNDPSDDIKQYVEKTKQLFLDGSMAPSPKERDIYSGRIYDIIEPLIPDMDEEFENDKLQQMLNGYKTHGNNPSSINRQNNQGKSQTVTIRLFTDQNGEKREDIMSLEQVLEEIRSFAKDKENALKIILYTGSEVEYAGSNFDASPIHIDIKINELHPQINLNLRKAYQNIYNKYRININSYNARFAQLLKGRVTSKENKYPFGAGISSKYLSDPQKRYWYRNVEGIDLPDVAFIFMIDGSGSMDGERCKSAMESTIILHEVLKKQGIEHAMVEHRAIGDKPEIDVNVLVDFNGREEEKYNLIQIDAYGNSRDALALFWAERYLNKHSYAENKFIIVISDGVPYHHYDEYYPPVSTQDTRNAVKKIMKRGIDVIAIALDSKDEYDCYDSLKEIYPHLIGCNDLKRLTTQLLGLVTKLL